MEREWGFWANCEASVVEKSIKFAGKVWKTTKQLSYVVASFCHSLPSINSKGRCFTAATLANSAHTAVMQLMDVEHELEFYGSAKDKICGAIAAVEFPSKEDAIAQESGAKPVAVRILFALWNKTADVQEALQELASPATAKDWGVSMECEWPMDKSAFFDGENFYEWATAPDDMKACVKPGSVDDYNGKPFYLVMGGRDGLVYFTGGGLTRNPADVNARPEQMVASAKRKTLVTVGWDSWAQAVAAAHGQEVGASAWSTQDAPDKFFAYVPIEAKGPEGKKSLRKLPLASKEKKGLDPAILRNALARFSQTDLPAGAKTGAKRKIMSAVRSWNMAHPADKIEVATGEEEAAITVIGETSMSEGHQHPVYRNMCIGVANGHSHGLYPLDFSPAPFSYEGITSPFFDGQVEHQHDVAFGAAGDEGVETSAAPVAPAQTGSSTPQQQEEGTMELKEMVRLLKEHAKGLAGKDDGLAKFLTEAAATLHVNDTAHDVEELVAARIKSGDLIPKEVHAKAVSEATAAGKTAALKEVEEKAAAETKRASTIAARLEAVKAAKLDEKFQVRKDATIASIVASIPVDENGEKEFQGRLEEWQNIAKLTGQATASATASGAPAVIPPTAGGASDKANKDTPAHAYL